MLKHHTNYDFHELFRKNNRKDKTDFFQQKAVLH
jgi:hypothetical protein